MIGSSLSERKVFNILLAYSDNTTHPFLKQTLRAAGYRRLLIVDSARDAINHLVSGNFDLLVTSTKLQDTTAWHLIRMVRSGWFSPPTLPVILLCEDQQMPLVEVLAHEHGAHPLPLTDLAPCLPQTITALLTPHEATKPAVLLIEDEERAVQIAKASLGNSYHLEIAYDGETGLAAWQARQHDLMLLDVRLPGLSGHSVLQQVMETKPTQAVVIVTADQTRDCHQNLMLGGALDCIHKPFRTSHLHRICEVVLRCSNYLQHYAEWQHREWVRDELKNRLWAANRCLNTGRTGMAAWHLRQALLISGTTPPTDDEWIGLLDEFNRS